ncbi:hypothetical protein R4419_22780, partial [Mycolicibacterium fortuitum]|nr:hypothetical protein [Mycolicibacterium fortuitum]MDV7260175.1 hypothetical protein [Mycolicibacterium fortuitum]MDV7292580.1 hypothetical protein [Mycolicibacterium fortuitum]MDV7299768.1 hypothetical protein [Mycolicibacterium fortuitum]MDV7306986.1 hypothetical protein [Mycolicibacterium fortuitum]
LIRYRLRCDVVRPQWVRAMLESPSVRARIESLAASSAGQHNLSLGKLNPLEIPVPAVEVQDESLARLSELEAAMERLNKEIVSAHVRGTNLRRSLVAAAFCGRLTTAAEMLEELESA